jgi:hypothetical protein
MRRRSFLANTGTAAIAAAFPGSFPVSAEPNRPTALRQTRLAESGVTQQGQAIVAMEIDLPLCR